MKNMVIQVKPHEDEWEVVIYVPRGPGQRHVLKRVREAGSLQPILERAISAATAVLKGVGGEQGGVA